MNIRVKGNSLLNQKIANFSGWLMTITLPLIWYWPRIIHASFGMIDDPSDLLQFSSMRSNFSAWLFGEGIHGEVALGRFRPFYWLARFFYFLMAGFHAKGWALFQYLNLVAALTATYFFVFALTQCRFIAILSCALWSFSLTAMENYLRLGPQEVWQVLYLSFLFLAMHHRLNAPAMKSHFMGWAFVSALTFALYFSKETSVVFLPFSLLMLIMSIATKQGIKTWAAFSLINLCVFILQHSLAPPPINYTAGYSLNLQTILRNLKFYFGEMQWPYLFLALFVLYCIRITISQKTEDSNLKGWQFGTLIFGLGFFAIYLPWGEPVRRYLLLAEYCFALFMGLELSHYVNRKLRHAAVWFAALLLAASTANPVIAGIHGIYLNAKGHKSPVYALHWLSELAPQNTRILVFEFEMELLHSTLVYLQIFDRRNDITVYSLSPHAGRYQKEGFNIVPIDTISEDLLHKTDYIFWHRRGPDRAPMEQGHQGMMNQLLRSKYQSEIKNIYSDLTPNGTPFPEGTEIWQIHHE